MPPSQALNEIRRLRRDRYGQVTRANRLNLTRGGKSSSMYSSSLDGDSNSGSTIRQRNQNKTSFIAQYTSNKKSFNSKFEDEKHESLSSAFLDTNYLEMKAMGLIPSMKQRYSFSNKLDQAMNGDYVIARDYDSQGDEEDYDDEEFCCIPGKDKFAVQKREYWRRRLRDCYIVFFIVMFAAASIQFFSHRISSEDSQTIQDAKEGFLVNIFDERQNKTETELTSKMLGKLGSLQEMTEAFNSTAETPFFLDIALTGSSVVKASLSKCHGLVLACELGLQQPGYDESVVQTFASTRNGYNAMYVNVDTSTMTGLLRAAKLGLIRSRKADVVAVKSLYDGAKLFHSEQQPARMFAMFAHPIANAVGYYHYLKKATWDERYDPDIPRMALRQFVSSKHVEMNPMVRLLSQLPGVDPDRTLTKTDLEVAKKVVETKCLVGLYRDIAGSLARFDRYFGWSESSTQRRLSNSNSTHTNEDGKKLGQIKSCRDGVTDKGDYWLQMQKKNDELKSDSVEYELLAEANSLDLKLYAHIENIYEVQGDKIFNVV